METGNYHYQGSVKDLLNSPRIKFPYLLFVILKLKRSEMIYREQVL